MAELDFCLKRRANEQYQRFCASVGSHAARPDGEYVLLNWTKCPDCPYHAGIKATVKGGVIEKFDLTREGMCVKEN